MNRYIRLLRFRYHPNFISVIAGVLFASERLALGLAGRVALLYLSFNILLYGGLYAFNEVTDLAADRKHPLKKKRPVASGEVTARAALVFAAVMTMLGLLAAHVFFGAAVVRLFWAFIAVNVLYSAAARRIPYVELAVNSLTHPLRFVLGARLAGGAAPPLFLAAYFFVALGFSCVRRVVELDVEGWRSRRALERYSRAGLLAMQGAAFAAVLALSAMDGATPKTWYAVVAAFYLGGVFGIYLFKPMRKLYRDSFTR